MYVGLQRLLLDTSTLRPLTNMTYQQIILLISISATAFSPSCAEPDLQNGSFAPSSAGDLQNGSFSRSSAGDLQNGSFSPSSAGDRQNGSFSPPSAEDFHNGSFSPLKPLILNLHRHAAEDIGCSLGKISCAALGRPVRLPAAPGPHL